MQLNGNTSQREEELDNKCTRNLGTRQHFYHCACSSHPRGCWRISANNRMEAQSRVFYVGKSLSTSLDAHHLSLMLNSEFPVMWSTLMIIYPILNLSAAALLPLQREAGFAQHPPSGPSVNLQPNITIQTANNTSSSENVVSINCDGGRFGGNLNVRSCRTIFNWVSTDEQQITFSQRHSGIPGDLGLPWRVYSRGSLCFPHLDWVATAERHW